MNWLKHSLQGLLAVNYLGAAAVGLGSGIISGLFGVGGGIILVPAMMLLMGVGIHTAVGSSLVVIIPTAVVGAFKHHQLGNVDWRMVASIIPTAAAGGYFGAWLSNQVAPDNLKRAFGGFLVLVGLRLIFQK